MHPDKLQDRIYEWFGQRYPDCGQWTHSDFHCYQDAPLELRVVLMTNRVEADVSNGGLAQLLWNCFFHWRVVLRDAAAGYRLFGAAEQEAAIFEFQRLFERAEPACRAKIAACVRTQDFTLFGEWCQATRAELDSPVESLFYDAADARRKDWLRRNETHLKRLMRQPR